jgi:hypothetical protein
LSRVFVDVVQLELDVTLFELGVTLLPAVRALKPAEAAELVQLGYWELGSLLGAVRALQGG